MVQSLVDAGGIKTEVCEEIVKRLLFREELGSTAQGRGIAIPHIEGHPSVKRSVAAVAISTEGIDFLHSPDGKNVQLFFMVIAPTDVPGDFLRVIEHLTRRLKDDTFCCSLKQCKTREAVLALLEEDDSKEKR
jgi:mannitol/fructose-specific phosphotransferase system IIA component (Ntr-type)